MRGTRRWLRRPPNCGGELGQIKNVDNSVEDNDAWLLVGSVVGLPAQTATDFDDYDVDSSIGPTRMLDESLVAVGTGCSECQKR